MSKLSYVNFASLGFWKTLIVGIACIILLRGALRLLFGEKRVQKLDPTFLAILNLVLLLFESRTTFFTFVYVALVTYCLIRWMPLGGKIWLYLGVALQAWPLIYFKYGDFIVTEVLRKHSTDFSELVIPVGISFYTFQMISLLVDIESGKEKKPDKFVNFVNFASFFPQIVAGPIERKKMLYEQVKDLPLPPFLDH